MTGIGFTVPCHSSLISARAGSAIFLIFVASEPSPIFLLYPPLIGFQRLLISSISVMFSLQENYRQCPRRSRSSIGFMRLLSFTRLFHAFVSLFMLQSGAFCMSLFVCTTEPIVVCIVACCMDHLSGKYWVHILLAQDCLV